MGNLHAKGAGTGAKGAANTSISNSRDSMSNAATPSPVEQATFKWVIDGFSSLLDKDQGWTYSNVFELMGVEWYLKLNPKYEVSNEECVSLRLELSQSSVKLDTIFEASFKFMIYDQLIGKHKVHLGNHSFQTASTSSAIAFMLPLKALRQSSRFIVNNSCVFGIGFIKVATIKVNTTLETLFVRKMNIFNEAKVYTWKIEDFSALKNPSHSPEFEIAGYTWIISLNPSYDGNSLSLFLKMKKTNDVPKGSGSLVEFALSIKDQENGKDRKYPGRCQFSSKHHRWGWKKFISLEDFKDSSKGYLIKGKCCIEAEVAISGSSKTEYSM
ncbi:MATH domain containing protein isoform X2 [Zea mays]|uniref:MATH domain-containing protein n=1 Tax=Zea mays TaxID=4577 RepID=A0A804QCL6_MAIZE|nr:MATH domain containing protein isoform X2 [Zea mays]XP_008650888.1 MATH domain containing protein isoform X2 [Zea mays]|eukprot:XP_008650887.1 MATH domain containing protein isoform X2 [Zea mays]